MNFKRLLYTKFGIILVSIFLGLGLATLFRKACEGKQCIKFNGPVISEVDGKTFKFGEYCYKYTLDAAQCSNTKKIVDIGKPDDMKPEGLLG